MYHHKCCCKNATGSDGVDPPLLEVKFGVPTRTHNVPNAATTFPTAFAIALATAPITLPATPPTTLLSA